MARHDQGILVTGGGTFLGDNIAAALLTEGSEVSLLLRAGTEDQLGPLAQHTRWSSADVWNPASLRGKARYHSAVVHTVGSLHDDPSQGLSYHQLNFVSARNIANMCVSDGVERLILLSSASAPWIGRAYIRSKREAEGYVRRVGLKATIIRAPLQYVRGRPRPLFYRVTSLLGTIAPLSLLPLARVAPMPVDILARAVARIALDEESSQRTYFARDLRRLNSREEIHARAETMGYFLPQRTQVARPYYGIEEDLPFGWVPGSKRP